MLRCRGKFLRRENQDDVSVSQQYTGWRKQQVFTLQSSWKQAVQHQSVCVADVCLVWSLVRLLATCLHGREQREGKHAVCIIGKSW